MKISKVGKIGILGVVVVAAVSLIYGCSKQDSDTYITQKLEKGKIIQKITASGIINPISTINIGTQVSGTISEILVDYNSLVKKGQLLAQIDPALFEATVAQRQAALDIARAEVDVSKNDIVYYKKIWSASKNLIPRATRLTKNSNLLSAIMTMPLSSSSSKKLK